MQAAYKRIGLSLLATKRNGNGSSSLGQTWRTFFRLFIRLLLLASL